MNRRSFLGLSIAAAIAPLMPRIPEPKKEATLNVVAPNESGYSAGTTHAGTYQYISVDARKYPKINRGQPLQWTGNEFFVEPFDGSKPLAGISVGSTDSLNDGWSLDRYPNRWFFIQVRHEPRYL